MSALLIKIGIWIKTHIVVSIIVGIIVIGVVLPITVAIINESIITNRNYYCDKGKLSGKGNNSICTYTDEVDLEYSCEDNDNYKLFSVYECRAKVSINATKDDNTLHWVCPDGYTNPGNNYKCVPNEIGEYSVKPITLCPDGYEKTSREITYGKKDIWDPNAYVGQDVSYIYCKKEIVYEAKYK